MVRPENLSPYFKDNIGLKGLRARELCDRLRQGDVATVRMAEHSDSPLQ